MINSGKIKTYLWNNMEHYIRLYHTCLLDLLFCVKDDTTDIHINRYNDFVNNYSKHINLISHSSVRHEQKYPYIGIDFSDYISGQCHIDINVSFRIVYNPAISPVGCSNGCQKCIKDPLEWADCISNEIVKMFNFKSQDIDGSNIDSNLFDFLRCTNQPMAANDAVELIDIWKWNVIATTKDNIIISPSEARNPNDELLEFNVLVPLRVTEFYSDKTCKCEEDPEACGC